MAKLDFDGLSYFWSKGKTYISNLLKGKADSSHTHDDRYYTESEINTKLNGKLNITLKGSANGLAELDFTGKVPSVQLPSFVDDVIEGYLYSGKLYKESAHINQITGETGKIYVDLHTEKTYRWSGTAFVVISDTITLGETSTTAYRGDRGKVAYDHSQTAHARTDATKVEKSSTNGNIKINGTETNVYIHPGSGTNPHGTTKNDVGLGNVDNTADSNKSVKYATSAGSATNATKVNNHTVNADVPSGAKFTDTVYTHPTTSGNKHIPSGGSSGQVLGWQSDGTAKWMTNDSSGGYINLGQFNGNNRTINLDIYKPYAECDSKGDNTTWFVPNDRNCVAWIRSKENTGTNPPQFGSLEFWFYFRSTMVNGMPLQEIIVYAAVNDGTPKNTYLNRAYCNAAWTSWWGDTDYLKLIGGVMTGTLCFSQGSPIQMKPASWGGYIHTLLCDGSVRMGVVNHTESWLWNANISTYISSTMDTCLRWKNGCGCYLQTIDDVSGSMTTKFAITSDNKVASYGLPYYEVVNGYPFRLIGVNGNNRLFIGGNTTTGDNNINIISLFTSNCRYAFEDTTFYTFNDDRVSLGNASYRWAQVYAEKTSISTSDRNLKHDIRDIDDNLIKLFFKIKPKTYYFNDGDRIHIGLVAQDFEDSMHELGLSENDYGMICKDILYDYTEFDEDGVPIEDTKVPKKDEDGNIIYRYSFRYEELITLIVQVVHNQQKELDDIRDNIAELNQKLENLK